MKKKHHTPAHTLEEDREKAMTAGCDDPVHFSQLLEQIEQQLASDF